MMRGAVAGECLSATAHRRVAIIDIGSNSIRLVVYDGPARSPASMFNEKVMAGLGRGLVANNGQLSAQSMDLALATLGRYRQLADAMQVESIQAVATAAVRQARNGAEFIDRIRRETGIAVTIIDGQTEALNAAYGLLAGIPDADGVIGDLGGGSLELARVKNGVVHGRASIPLGSLRLAVLHREGRDVLRRAVRKAVADVQLGPDDQGRHFYAVGGSWRALAQLHMHLVRWPLPIVHQHRISRQELDRLMRSLAHMSEKSLRNIPEISSARVPQLPATVALMRAIVQHFDSKSVIFSAYGLREGVLLSGLPDSCRTSDPLLAAARDMAWREGRFANGHQDFPADAIGDALLTFSDGLFPEEAPALRRLRHAACLLADTSWRAHPTMRAENAVDQALHGTWAGIEAHERALLANALWVVNGGGDQGRYGNLLRGLARPNLLQLTTRWGLALRLGQRLSAGVPGPLARAGLGFSEDGSALWLSLPPDQALLYGKPVQRRHQALAQAFAARPELRLQ